MAFETNSGVLIKLVAKDDNRTDEEGQSWSVQAQRQKEDKSEITIGALEMELVKIRNEQENKTIVHSNSKVYKIPIKSLQNSKITVYNFSCFFLLYCGIMCDKKGYIGIFIKRIFLSEFIILSSAKQTRKECGGGWCSHHSASCSQESS